MKCDAERLIEALIGSQLMADRARAQEMAAANKPVYVVTVSRGYGALGKEVAQALADHLGVRCCDRRILQEVARTAHVDLELVKTLDEHVKRIKGDWWHALANKKTFSREQYFQYLVKVVLSISHKGGVIVGRGAHLILGPCRAFRVRIVGTPDYCAKRIAAREKLDLEDARRRVLEVNRERRAYIRELYDADVDDVTCYDLVMNSDRFSVEQMVDSVLLGMQHAGYELPEKRLKVSSS